ncbi:dipeptidase [Candidatus Woesearchaeota archaeon]|nr:dipeptidase [Candidatus Woesearchaeota archaeon]
MGFQPKLNRLWEEEGEHVIDDIVNMIQVESISVDGNHGEEVRLASQRAGALAEELGFESQVVDVDGTHYVQATLEGNSPFHFVFYGHTDVQPVEEEKWDDPPFAPPLQGIKKGKVYGRGAIDDKGPVVSVLHGLAAARNSGSKVPTITAILECEEETASPNFPRILRAEKELFEDADGVFVFDTGNEGGQPTITYSLRGAVKAYLSLVTAESPVHSGIGGGLANNPLIDMSGVIYNTAPPRRGKLLIPGVYENVSEFSEAEIRELERIARITDVAKVKKELGVIGGPDRSVEMYLRELYAQPTFDVHNVEGGIKGTTVPDHCRYEISMRIAPGQDPEHIAELLTEHVRRLDDRVDVEIAFKLHPYKTAIEHPSLQIAATALQQVHGVEPYFAGCGGSIGAVAYMAMLFPELPIVLFGVGEPKNNMHGHNENIRLDQVEKVYKTSAMFSHMVANKS